VCLIDHISSFRSSSPKRWMMQGINHGLILLLVAILATQACLKGSDHRQSPQMAPFVGGTESQLHQGLGAPESSAVSSLVPMATVEAFKGHPERYQIIDERVVASFRSPVGEEERLQFWQQRWKDTLVVHETVRSGPHGAELVQYRASEKNESVVFDLGKERVVEVVSHAD